VKMAMDRNEARWLERLEWNRRRLADLARGLESGPPADDQQPETVARAQAAEVRLTHDAMLRLLAENQDQIERALERLRDGRYGTCEDCGGAIPPERLQFRPEATRCLECQRRSERQRPARLSA
jgi:RNA polymerase-binding transcription factor